MTGPLAAHLSSTMSSNTTTTTTMSNNEIRFRFIRKADFHDNSGANDDVITLKHADHNLFSLNYIHRYRGDAQRTYVIVKEADALTWLTSMLSLLGADKDPFYRIQMDLPCFPSILLDSYNLETKLYDIVEAVRFSMINYPLPSRVVKQEVRASVYVDEADQGEADEGEADEGEVTEEEGKEDEGEYDDMPGLVPAEDAYAEMPPVTPIRTHNFVPAYEGRRHLFLDHEEATSAESQAGGTPA